MAVGHRHATGAAAAHQLSLVRQQLTRLDDFGFRFLTSALDWLRTREPSNVVIPFFQSNLRPNLLRVQYTQRRGAQDSRAGSAHSESSLMVRLVDRRHLPRGGLEIHGVVHPRGQPLGLSLRHAQPVHLSGGQQLTVRRQGDGQVPAGRREDGAVRRGPPLRNRQPDETVRGHRVSARENRRQDHHLLPAQRPATALLSQSQLEKNLPKPLRPFQRSNHPSRDSYQARRRARRLHAVAPRTVDGDSV